MKIERRNILDLIGNHRGKFHSCILACYNFDFSFFEERVLPTLRTANIKNVNVLADGNFLEQAQELTTGREFLHNKSYNFLPIYEKGVFHPKIMLLTGIKHGLLIIGSGNISSSGLSTNDEIWGAFHLDSTKNENAPLFSEVWNYLLNFTAVKYGFLYQKIEWIKTYSPWLADLPQSSGPIYLPSLNQSLQFIFNKENQSIYQQLVTLVSQENLKCLNVVSPYYDKDGSLLKQLLEDFKPETFNCIVDTSSGTLPCYLDPEDSSIIKFYQWQSCIDDYLPSFNRLHAKIFHFQYSDGSEKMILGSANATLAALGSKVKSALNAEACLLISRDVSGHWLNDLNIKLPERSIDISKYSNINGLDSTSMQRNNHLVKIIYSELRGNEITCYLNKNSDEPIFLAVNIRSGTKIETVPVTIIQNIVNAKIENVSESFKVCLLDANGLRVSNYSIIHRYEILLHCNPDPTQEKLNTLLEKDFPDGEGVTLLLEYVDYNWADDDLENQVGSKRSGFIKNIKNEGESQDEIYQILSQDEFNKVNNEIWMEQSGLLTTNNIKLADFLHLLLKGDALNDAEYNENEEQKLLEDKDQIGEGSQIVEKVFSKVDALKEKRALKKYFGKLEKTYANKLDSFYKAKALSVSPTEVITLKVVSKMLIALQLIQLYRGKKFVNIDKNKDEFTFKEERYLIDGTLNGDYDTLKGFVINVLGKFLLLSTAGINKYNYEMLNQKMNQYQGQIFEKALLLILSLPWNSQEEKRLRLTLLLNLHYYFAPFKTIDDGLLTKIIERNVSNFNISIINHENEYYYYHEFIPKYQNWLNIFKSNNRHLLIKKTNVTIKGDVIFNSKIGFNHIYKKMTNKKCELDLTREGYPSTMEGNILKKIMFGNNCISF